MGIYRDEEIDRDLMKSMDIETGKPDNKYLARRAADEAHQAIERAAQLAEGGQEKPLVITQAHRIGFLEGSIRVTENHNGMLNRENSDLREQVQILTMQRDDKTREVTTLRKERDDWAESSRIFEELHKKLKAKRRR